MSITRVALVGILVVIVGRSAHAAPIFYSIAAASATYHGFPAEVDSDSQLVYSTDALGPLHASLPGGSAWASVQDAALRAYATTDGQGTSASGYAGFFDTLTLESSTLPGGTEVQLRAELVFSRQVSPNGVPANEPCYLAAVAYGGIDAGNGQGSAGSVFVQDSTCDTWDIDNPVAYFTGFIGEELTINAYLAASVSAFTSASVDAGNTLRFFITPVGDFMYTTASGNSYVSQQQTPVPEPSILTLLGAAFSIVGIRTRDRFRG